MLSGWGSRFGGEGAAESDLGRGLSEFILTAS